MSADRYRLNTSGLQLNSAGVDPRLERVLAGLGMVTTSQLYGAMIASPAAFEQLLKDFDITYCELRNLLESQLTEDEKAKLAGASRQQYGMGQLGAPPSSGPTIVRRDNK